MSCSVPLVNNKPQKADYLAANDEIFGEEGSVFNKRVPTPRSQIVKAFALTILSLTAFTMGALVLPPVAVIAIGSALISGIVAGALFLVGGTLGFFAYKCIARLQKFNEKEGNDLDEAYLLAVAEGARFNNKYGNLPEPVEFTEYSVDGASTEHCGDGNHMKYFIQH